MIEIECSYTEPAHVHVYPDDWIFGGADGLHPGADPRYKPSIYTYYDTSAKPIHTTVVPLCDDEAIDKFTDVAGYGPGFNPVWLSVQRPDGSVEMLPWLYDKATDTATERKIGGEQG